MTLFSFLFFLFFFSFFFFFFLFSSVDSTNLQAKIMAQSGRELFKAITGAFRGGYKLFFQLAGHEKLSVSTAVSFISFNFTTYNSEVKWQLTFLKSFWISASLESSKSSKLMITQ